MDVTWLKWYRLNQEIFTGETECMNNRQRLIELVSRGHYYCSGLIISATDDDDDDDDG